MDQVRNAIRLNHYSYRTQQAYVGWIKRYITFHDLHHPSEMGAPQVEASRSVTHLPSGKTLLLRHRTHVLSEAK